MTCPSVLAAGHLLQLPDEILLEILKLVTPEDLSRVKQVCWRLRSIVLNYTVRLDHNAFLKDTSVSSISGFADLILQCPRLKVLSLIHQPEGGVGVPVCFMERLMRCGKRRAQFAKQLAASCPVIRVFEVASLPTLRLVRDYVRSLKQTSALTEIRLYSCNSIQVRILMLAIARVSPCLRIFKFLRRAPAAPLPPGDTGYAHLWDQLAPRLTGFSTNVSDRSILTPALTRLTGLRRLVVWFLVSEEIDLLTRHATQLHSLILMSADVAGFRFLVRLQHLTDLTFSLAREQRDSQEVAAFADDFDSVFRVVGRRLQRASFDLRNASSGACLASLAHCHQLRELKLRGLTDASVVLHALLGLRSLRSVVWKDETGTHTDISNHSIQKLFKSCPSLAKFVLNEVMYTRRRQECDSKPAHSPA